MDPPRFPLCGCYRKYSPQPPAFPLSWGRQFRDHQISVFCLRILGRFGSRNGKKVVLPEGSGQELTYLIHFGYLWFVLRPRACGARRHQCHTHMTCSKKLKKSPVLCRVDGWARGRKGGRVGWGVMGGRGEKAFFGCRGWEGAHMYTCGVYVCRSMHVCHAYSSLPVGGLQDFLTVETRELLTASAK